MTAYTLLTSGGMKKPCFPLLTPQTTCLTSGSWRSWNIVCVYIIIFYKKENETLHRKGLKMFQG